MSIATPGRPSVVFDASAALRAVVDRNDQALYWFAGAEQGEVDAAWPELALVEIAHGLLRLVRGGRFAAADAFRETARFIAAPIRVESLAPLTLPALHLATKRALSVYDAAYVVLAESLDAQLVTADRRLAAAAERSVLIGD